MNRKILFLLVVILANAKAIAQTEILTAIDMGERISKTIVRQVSDGSPKHIVYAEGALSNYFVLADHTHASTMRIESRYEVNDFAILGDYLYFVGRDQDLDQGCVGWIKINSFFIGSGEYFVSDPGFGQTGNCLIRSLDKLVLNQSSNRISITAIGSSFNTLNNNNFCININGLEGMTTGWGYELVYSHTGEEFHDIIQTDRYVVTGGKYYSGFRGICLRIFDKNNPFGSPIYQTAHVYHGDSEIQDGLDKIRLTSIPGDLAASVSFFDSVCPILPHPNEYAGIDLQLYDIDATVNLPNQCTLDKKYVIQSNVAGLCGVKEVVYNASSTTLTTLIDSDSPASRYDFAVETILSPTGFTASMFTRWHHFANYHSLCDDGSANSHTIAGIFTNNNSTDLLMGTRRCQTRTNCGTIGVTYAITPFPSCSKEETFQPLHLESGIVNFEEHQEAVDEIESRNVCIEN